VSSPFQGFGSLVLSFSVKRKNKEDFGRAKNEQEDFIFFEVNGFNLLIKTQMLLQN
jgi:hypothetical protein